MPCAKPDSNRPWLQPSLTSSNGWPTGHEAEVLPTSTKRPPGSTMQIGCLACADAVFNRHRVPVAGPPKAPAAFRPNRRPLPAAQSKLSRNENVIRQTGRGPLLEPKLPSCAIAPLACAGPALLRLKYGISANEVPAATPARNIRHSATRPSASATPPNACAGSRRGDSQCWASKRGVAARHQAVLKPKAYPAEESCQLRLLG